MGLAEWFAEFCGNIAVKDAGTIGSRYKLITKRLNIEYRNTESDTAHSLYIGSYGRNTAIQGFSDLDMVYELPAAIYAQYDKYTGNGQSALLQAVKTAIAKTYSTSEVGGDGQVVVIRFKDGITFEVLPAFVNKAGSYNYPNANDGGSWKSTNPRPEIEAIRSRNQQSNGNLVLLCRMMRAWRSKWEVPLGGLLLDTLAYQFIENWAHRDKAYLYYDYMSRDFFGWMKDQDSDRTHWRAPGSGDYVYSKGPFQYKATRCYNLSVEAIGHETATPKREYSAKQKWREVFGTAFPN